MVAITYMRSYRADSNVIVTCCGGAAAALFCRHSSSGVDDTATEALSRYNVRAVIECVAMLEVFFSAKKKVTFDKN